MRTAKSIPFRALAKVGGLLTDSPSQPMVSPEILTTKVAEHGAGKVKCRSRYIRKLNSASEAGEFVITCGYINTYGFS